MVFLAHAAIAFIGKAKQRKGIITALYAVSILLAASFLIFPDAFLLQSVPKLYFPNYYQAGELYWLIVLWCTVVQAYSLVELFLAYRPRSNHEKPHHMPPDRLCAGIRIRQSRLFFDIQYSRRSGMVVLFDTDGSPYLSRTPPIKYELSDIRIIAKQALIYFILIEILGVIISLFILFTDYIRQTFPDLPIWTLPIFFAVLFVSVGVFIWRRLSETDVLKYEFITVVTHSSACLSLASNGRLRHLRDHTGRKKSIDTILESKTASDPYHILVHLSARCCASTIILRPWISDSFLPTFRYAPSEQKRKGIVISFSSSPGLFVLADAEKSIFIFQILLDNALNYTPAGNGSISVRAYVSQNGKHGVIEVSDTGIGMSPETASRVFRRRYRGENAKHTDTEGMGIGLFIAKSIVEKQDGKIYVRSEGEGKGSTFSIYLPLYKPVQ